MTQDIFRVYRLEWIVVFACSCVGYDATEEAMMARARSHFAEDYAGRVRERDVRYTVAGTGSEPRVLLELLLPNLKAEWKTRQLAETYVAEQGWQDTTIVMRNSRADDEIRSYGVILLPDAEQ